MIKRLIVLFLNFTVLLTLVNGCKKIEPKDRPVIVNPFSEATDSLFGYMTEKQLYYQHVIIEVPNSYQFFLDSLVSYVIDFQPGGIKLMNWNLDSVDLLKSRLDTFDIIQPLFYANYFEEIGTEPYSFWLANDTLKNSFYTAFFRKTRHGILDFAARENFRSNNYFDTLINRDKLVPIIAKFSDHKYQSDYTSFIQAIRGQKASIELSISIFDTINFGQLKKANKFDGFLFSRNEMNRTNNLLTNGLDFIYSNPAIEKQFLKWNKELKTEEFINSTKKILAAKQRIEPTKGNTNLFAENKFLRLNYQLRTTALINNKTKLIPFEDKFTLYTVNKVRVSQKIREASNFRSLGFKEDKLNSYIQAKGSKIILLPDSLSSESIRTLKSIKKKNNCIIGFQNPEQYSTLKSLPNLLFIPKMREMDYGVLVQQLKGRLSLSGDFSNKDSIVNGVDIEKKGLARTPPELVGMSSDSLKKIEYSINAAMKGRAFPGCQVILAKNGCIIYDKCFGFHSYNREQPVTKESIYDLASLTKVVATTLIGMKLYELKAYDPKDSLIKYLPDSLSRYLKYPSTIRNITFQELFTHTSGLPSGFPIIDYMQYTSKEVGRFDKYYCDWEDSTFTIQVAEDYYMNKVYSDSMWFRLNQIFLDPAKSYKYSDVSMNTLYYFFSSIINSDSIKFSIPETDENIGKNSFEECLYTNFYEPLGMNNSKYRPLRFFDKNKIVPTEDEKYWRKQLLQGSVHDPNAALMGGVAGNAGMFSSTNDLVKLMQMLLNKGEFEGKRYLNAETVSKFTAAQEGSHRGLGWNKPTLTSTGYGISDYATLQTFGHTGFTGTCIWVDPASEIVYIFLSNRVHPTINNRIYQFGVRKSIHQHAYKSLIHESYGRSF